MKKWLQSIFCIAGSLGMFALGGCQEGLDGIKDLLEPVHTNAEKLPDFFEEKYKEWSLVEIKDYAEGIEECTRVKLLSNNDGVSALRSQKGILRDGLTASTGEVGEKYETVKYNGMKMEYTLKSDIVRAPFGETCFEKRDEYAYEDGITLERYQKISYESAFESYMKKETARYVGYETAIDDMGISVVDLKSVLAALSLGVDYSLGAHVGEDFVKIKYERAMKANGNSQKETIVWVFNMQFEFVGYALQQSVVFPERSKLDYNGENTYYNTAYIMPWEGIVNPPEDISTYQ